MLIHINQHKTDKQILERKIEDVDNKKTRYKSFTDYNYNYKISDVQIKTTDTSSLVTCS